jgi:hypothetical protein
MTKKTITDTYRLVVWIMMLVVSAAVTAQGDYEIVWSTIDGGGGQSSGGPYILTGTIGQPDAGYLGGDNYELLGGFWVGGPLCIVEFEDFARFAVYWMQSGIDLPADLYPDDVVNYDDLLEFANFWLCICPYDWPLR